MVSVIVAPFIAVNGLAFLIAICLFLYSVCNDLWHEPNAPRSVRLSLTICAVLYLLAIFLGFLFYLMVSITAPDSLLDDPRDHPAVKPVFYLIIFVYAFAILLNIYVWIQRLRHVYSNSSYGYSVTYMKSLYGGYFILIALAVITLCLFPFNDNESPSQVLRTIIRVFTFSFAALFVGLSLAISVTFILKLKTMGGLLQGAGGEDEETLVFVHDLTRLQMKLTVLVCVQVLSTLIGVVLLVPLEDDETPAGISIDAFVGFMCMYCTLAAHDSTYCKACFLCTQCCGLCFKIPEQASSSKTKAKVEAIEASAVVSKSVEVTVTVDNAAEKSAEHSESQ